MPLKAGRPWVPARLLEWGWFWGWFGPGRPPFQGVRGPLGQQANAEYRRAGPGLELMQDSDRNPPRECPSWDRGELLQQVVELIRRRHLSQRTEKTYLRWIRRYIS